MTENRQLTDKRKLSLLNEFKNFYQDGKETNIERLDRIYTQDIEFRDPVHSVLGILALKSYIKGLYANSHKITFEYTDDINNENCASINWLMHFQHPSIASGKEITLRGSTFVRFTDRIYYQEDFYDLGAMIYQHVPVLGSMVNFVNNRLRH
ncbi:MAG: nuclear transport factor 2 family protein [Gammaproteobacteria bacterium]